MNRIPGALRNVCIGLNFLLAACASTHAPTDQLESARAVIGQAQPVAAKEAPLEMQQAIAKLERAEALAAAGNNPGARRLAEQAEVDARLAWTVAENARIRRAAREIYRNQRIAEAEAGPPASRSLEEARGALQIAADDPRVQLRAPVELTLAERTLDEAERLRQARAPAAEVEHQAYVAGQRARIAMQTAQYRELEAKVATSRERTLN